MEGYLAKYRTFYFGVKCQFRMAKGQLKPLIWLKVSTDFIDTLLQSETENNSKRQLIWKYPTIKIKVCIVQQFPINRYMQCGVNKAVHRKSVKSPFSKFGLGRVCVLMVSMAITFPDTMAPTQVMSPTNSHVLSLKMSAFTFCCMDLLSLYYCYLPTSHSWNIFQILPVLACSDSSWTRADNSAYGHLLISANRTIPLTGLILLTNGHRAR